MQTAASQSMAQSTGGATPAGPANIFEFSSADISEFAKAFAGAQGHIKRALKDNTNPHFGSRYADLASVQEACMEALTGGGFSVVQPLIYHPEMKRTFLVTRVLHTSGQWMQSSVPIDDAKGAQAFGSFVTYMRRYSLAAIVGVASDDDDGNAATAAHAAQETREAKGAERVKRRPAPAPERPTPPAAAEHAKPPTPEEAFEQNRAAISAAPSLAELQTLKIRGGKWMSEQQVQDLRALRQQRLAELGTKQKAAAVDAQAPAQPPSMSLKSLELYTRLVKLNRAHADQLRAEAGDDQELVDLLHTALCEHDPAYKSARGGGSLEQAPLKTMHPDYQWDEQ